jgi:N-acetyl-anhydromuramyl-L-alanine amidase AmpD
VSYLMTLHKIPKENIIRHHDYDPKRKWDVWDNFRNPYFKNWEEYRNSYKPKEIEKLQLEEQDYLDSLLESNWKMYHKTKNKEMKDLLHSISNQIRAFIEKHK